MPVEIKEINEPLQKPKVLVLLGADILRLMHGLPELEQEIMHKDPNRQVINSALAKIKLEDISNESCDIVSIYAHGNADAMQIEQGVKKHKIAFCDLIDGERLTIKNLLHIQSKTHNRHFDIKGAAPGGFTPKISRYP